MLLDLKQKFLTEPNKLEQVHLSQPRLLFFRMYTRTEAEPGPSEGYLPPAPDSDNSEKEKLGSAAPAGGAKQQKRRAEYLKQIWDSLRISVFVVGSALVVFISATNSVTW